MQTYLEIPVGPQTLAACLHRPDPGGGPRDAPVVICCHGLTGSRIGAGYRLVGLGRRLAAENIACLRFDFRGCGESDGRFEDVCVEALVQDLLSVVSAVDRLEGCDPTRIGIVGSSFGAYTASHAAGQIEALRCLVFWAPVADPGSLIRQEMTDADWALLREQGWIEHHGLRLGRGFFDPVPDADGPTVLARVGRPLLIFHATGDRQVPIEHGRAYAAAMAEAGVDVRLDALDVENHAMRSVADSDRIVNETVAWFRRFLTGRTCE